MTRPATRDDLPQLLAMGRAMHAESPFWRRLKFSESRLAETLADLMGSPNGFAWVAEKDGQLVGALLACVQEHWMSGDRVVTELAFYVAPGARGQLHAGRLVTALVTWAQEVGAAVLFAGVSTGLDTERIAQFYERFGFSRNGAIALEKVI